MRLCLAAFLGAGLLVAAGCSTLPPDASVTWAEFDGDQEAWPTQVEGLMHSRDGFPIYHLSQCPPNDYEVLGYIRTSKPAARNSADDELAVVKMAASHGGQAVLVAKEIRPSFLSESYKTDYLVVKFKPQPAAKAIENIDTFLALTAGITGDFTGVNARGEMVHLSAGQLAAERKEMMDMKARLLASPELQKAH